MAAGDLTNLDDVKIYLQIDLDDIESDEVLGRFITDASAAIRLYTGRRFTTSRVSETRTFTPRRTGRLYLDELFAKADIQSVTDEYGSALSDYQFLPDEHPRAGSTLVFRDKEWFSNLPMDHRDNFIYNLSDPMGIPEGPVSVSGTFGYAEADLPHDIEYQARRTTGIWYKAESGFFTEFSETSAGFAVVPGVLPPQIEKALDQYKLRGPVVA